MPLLRIVRRLAWGLDTPRFFAIQRIGPLTWAAILCFSSFSASAQQPVGFQYFYDNLNRLVVAADSTGVSVRYSYDAAGNILQTTRSITAPGAPSIFNATPITVSAGGTITIQGQGFSTTPSLNTVTIGGLSATVISSTATTLVVMVPSGATNGTITVTVGGMTTTFGFETVVSLPQISSVTPDGEAGGVTSTVTLQGINLTGATFSVSQSAGTVSSPTVNSSGTQATLQVLAGSQAGIFNIVATNSAGGSSPLAPANQFIILTATGSTATEVSVLNSGASPGSGTAASPSLSVVNTGGAPGTNVFATPALAVTNVAFAPGTDAVQSLWLSVCNNTTGTACPASGNARPKRPASPVSGVIPGGRGEGGDRSPSTVTGPAVVPLGLTLVPPRADGDGTRVPLKVFVGETVPLELVGGDGAATLALNGLLLDSPVPDGRVLFTVPSGPESVRILASAGGTDALPLQFKPVPDPGRTVHGKLLSPNGNPLSGTRIEFRTTGLNAEFFDWQFPLTALPDLADRKPDRVGFVSALNMVNPGGIFGNDPFGTGMTPDYAARFTGWILVDQEGEHRFILTSHAGSRLSIDGALLAEVPFGLTPGTAAATVSLKPGWHALDVLHFETVGAAELQLEWARNGAPREVVAPDHLSPKKIWEAVSDANGEFILPAVPSILDIREFRAPCPTVAGPTANNNEKCTVVLE